MAHLFAHRKTWFVLRAVNEFLKMSSAMHHKLRGVLWIVYIFIFLLMIIVYMLRRCALGCSERNTKTLKGAWVTCCTSGRVYFTLEVLILSQPLDDKCKSSDVEEVFEGRLFQRSREGLTVNGRSASFSLRAWDGSSQQVAIGWPPVLIPSHVVSSKNNESFGQNQFSLWLMRLFA